MLLKTGSAHGVVSSRDLLNWMDVSAACPQTKRVGGEMAIGVANLQPCIPRPFRSKRDPFLSLPRWYCN